MGPARRPLLVLLAGALGVVGLPPAMVAAAAAAEGDATPSCGGSITIVDSAKADPYPSTISVAAPTGGVITDLNVTLLGVTHTHPEDIRARLAAPDGSTAAELMSNAGGGDDLSDVSLTFDDEAAAEIPDEDAIASGTYRPAMYAGGGNNFPAPTPAGPPDLSQFDGIDPSGVWSLYVYDDLPGDIGSIDGWELEIDTTVGSVGVGPPVVGGTSAVGQTLSVTSPAMWCPAPTSRTYQWYADDVAISGATGSSYTLTADDLGAMVHVVETSSGIPSAVAASDAVGPVGLGTFTSSGTPSIAESTLPVGEPLTALEGNWSPAPDTSSFEWFVEGDKVGEGATYTPVAGDLGKRVTVQVTVTKAGYTTRTATSAPRTVTDPNADALKINELRPTLNVDPDYFDVPWVELYNPTDSAINLVGLELSSNGPGLSEAVVPLTGVLPARGFLEVATPGFVERDYFVYLAHSSGRTIDLVRWQGEPVASFGLCGDGFDPFPGWSSPGLIRTNTATPGGPNDCNAVLINEISSTGGWVEVINTGSTSRDLTGTSVAASGGEVDLEGVLGPRETHMVDLPNTGYAVFRDIPGPSYDTVAFLNQTTATSWGRCPDGAGHADDRAFFETAAATPGAPNDCTDLVADELPSISGTPRVGDTLTATPAEWPQEPDEVTYQWFADGEPIPGATGPTFVPTPAQAGLMITVVETATEAGHDLGRATSDAVGPVTGGSFTNNAAPSIDGTARAGATVTITQGSWTPAPVERSYEWFVGTELVGVGSSYTPLPGDVGGQLTVVETVKKAGYDDASKTSAPAQVLPGQLVNDTPPTITGTGRVGEQLTANTGSWDPTATGSSFEWFVDGDPRGSGSTYTPVSGDLGKEVVVKETVTRTGYDDATEASAELTVQPGAFTNNAAPSIDGTPRAGATVTITPGSWTPAPVERSYEWFVGTELVGVGSSYTPLPGDVGGQLTVVETVKKAGYDDASKTSAPAQVLPGQLVNDTPPTITGEARVGEELTAQAGEWTPDPVTSTFTWYADGDLIPGATGATFVPGPAELGEQITVVETVTRPSYADETSESVPTAAVLPGIIDNLSLPAITGDPRAYSTLNVSPGTWDPAHVDLTYQWYVDGAAAPGATGDSFTLRASDLGLRVSVRVTATEPGYDPTSVEARWVGPVQTCLYRQVAPVEIRGQAIVGTTLRALPGAWVPEPAATSYQWYADGHLIPGATGAEYTPTPADLRKQVTVEVTVSKPACESSTAESPATGDVEPGTLKTLSKPRIVGDLVVGHNLTLEAGEWDADPVTLTYQWTRGGEPIPGATDPTYTPTPDDVTQWLAVVIIVSSPGYGDLRSVTPAAFPIAPVRSENTVAPSISGGPRLGETLTADPGQWSFEPETLAYEWFAGALRIGGQTGPELALDDPAWVGETISVKVTASSEVQPPATASSDATTPVQKAKPTVAAEFSTITPKAKRTKVRVDITVTAPAGLPVTGRVRVMVAGKRVATARLGDGSVQVTLPVFRTKGQRTVVVRYDGSELLTKAAARTVVRVR